MKFIALILCFSLFGINSNKETIVEKEKKEYMPYEIYMENNKEKAPFEKDKCMSGAYIYDENNYADIKSFENYIGINNDIYVSILSKGKDLPIREIVDCYAKGKIPMLEIEKDFGSSQAMSAAKICGNLDIPMFVEIKSESKYIYECIAEIFKTYTPKAVLVYGIDSDDTGYEFPREELVDWVAVNAKEKMSNGSILSEYENISRWCSYFKDKTIMLNISVPNFSIDRCNYVYNEAANEISRLYTLASEYNNVGAINYISCIDKNDNMVISNYRITENAMITGAYKAALGGLISNRYWNKTSFVAYVSDDNVIVSNNILKVLGLKGKYINSGYSEINVSGFNKSERKVFVKS